MTNNRNLPCKSCDILLPNKNIDLNKWSCVACDQYTSEPSYWDRVSSYTEGFKSTYNLMLPEIYLEDNDVDEKINKINDNMDKYLNSGVFDEYKDSMVLVERSTPFSPVRTGLVMAFDLEQYDYKKGSTSKIRATEGTVTERIPPRMLIRKNASLEMPHILILIDDPHKTVIEPVKSKLEAIKAQITYDFTLMENGGTIKGTCFNDESIIQGVYDAISELSEKNQLLFAVGDGNHSLAAAKCHYEETKNPEARYALAELVNIHDAGIIFEPIHRVIFGIGKIDLINEMKSFFGDSLCFDTADSTYHKIEFVFGEDSEYIYIKKDFSMLAVGAIQKFLDYLTKKNSVKVDYIHGEDTVRTLAAQNAAGFIVPGMGKSELFPTVEKDGALPRKTFSMGHACEKRYYLECRRIK